MAQQSDHIRHNVLVLSADFIFFSIGLTFWDPVVVVPSFVQDLTGSTVAVGLLTAVRVLVFTIPQIWAASYLMGKPYKKPLLVWSSLGGRLPLALLALATLLWAKSAVWLVGVILAVTYAAFYTSEGLNGISWPDLVGKVIPAHIRGRFLGAGQLFSSLGALGAGYLVKVILGANGLSYPINWVVLFTCALGGMMLSLGAISLTREEADETLPQSTVNVRRDALAVVNCLRADSRLRHLITVQLILGLAGATFPFLVIRAREVVVAGDEILGLFLIAQNLGGMISALLLGNLIDHIGSWAAIRILTIVQVACLLVVSIGSLAGYYWATYLVAFALLGFVNGGAWWSYTSYILDIASEKMRPLYLAASGILQVVNALSAVLVGLLLNVFTAEAVFGAAAALSAAGAALAWTLPKFKPRRHSPDNPAIANTSDGI
ncbi:MAG: MFS transporter [Chloroflexi bacterium]|nr:MFS transporter [Chloroflexota bacterium]